MPPRDNAIIEGRSPATLPHCTFSVPVFSVRARATPLA